MIGVSVVFLLLLRSDTLGQKTGLFKHFPFKQMCTFGDTDRNPVIPPQLKIEDSPNTKNLA